MKLYKIALLCSALCAGMAASADEPAGYYLSCEGKNGKELLTALCGVISNHTTVSYDGLWTLYQKTDLKDNGKIWDMYSTKEYTYKTNQCGTYKSVGDCYNREHSFPKSWFNDKSPMVSDAFHIYPTDGKVNGQRSNNPYGECANGTTLPSSGSVKALGKLGASTFEGYTGTVFEPDDEYKGDFARSYFYMAACYNTQISGWSSPMLAGNSYPAFTSWAVNLLLKWHRQDPVSAKEIKRNEAVYSAQKNRNPFIDHPELAEYIWGNMTSAEWTASSNTDPALTLPVSGSTVDLGTTVVGAPRSTQVTVKGISLDSDVLLSVSGDGFVVSPATISAKDANSTDGYAATVTFTPTAQGSFTGTLTVACGSLSSSVTLTASAINTLPVGPVSAIGEDSFVATWSYIGDADTDGNYTLDVTLDGKSISGYPRSVVASAESALVEDLNPLTTYAYTVASQHLTSEPLNVTTLAPQPSIEFLYDGELEFNSITGEESNVAELLLLIENITDPIQLSVDAPFQLSTDRSSWQQTITIDPEEDRIYVRMLSATAGVFTTAIVATAGDYTTDEVVLRGVVMSNTGFVEDFEVVDESAATYNAHTYQGTASLWNFTNAGIFPNQDTLVIDKQAVRFGTSSTSQIATAEPYPYGFGVVTLQTAKYNKDADATFVVEYSTDGDNWTSAGSAQVTTTAYATHTFTLNVASSAYLRIRQTAGKRFMLDQIEASTFVSGSNVDVPDYHQWDAFCRDGKIVLHADHAVTAKVYALDGTTIFAGTVAPGEIAIDATAGLYIVAVDDFARRVLVK